MKFNLTKMFKRIENNFNTNAKYGKAQYYCNVLTSISIGVAMLTLIASNIMNAYYKIQCESMYGIPMKYFSYDILVPAFLSAIMIGIYIFSLFLISNSEFVEAAGTLTIICFYDIYFIITTIKSNLLLCIFLIIVVVVVNYWSLGTAVYLKKHNTGNKTDEKNISKDPIISLFVIVINIIFQCIVIVILIGNYFGKEFPENKISYETIHLNNSEYAILSEIDTNFLMCQCETDGEIINMIDCKNYIFVNKDLHAISVKHFKNKPIKNNNHQIFYSE